jgi:type I restriction enzyme S subunit
MNNWHYIELGDYIDIITDYHANGAYEKLKENITLKYYPDYAIMIRTLNFESNDFKDKIIYLNEFEYNYLSKSKVQPFDIIMNKIANPGSVYLMPNLNRPVSLAMNLFLIRFNEKIDQRFIYYLMKFNEDYIKRFANGTATKSITKDAVRALKFKVPNLSYQKQISSLLSSLDAKIELNSRINSELEAMAKTLYDYWFVQFDFPDSNGKPYKTSGGKMVWSEELKREIPEGWEVKIVDDILTKEMTTKKIPSSEIREKGLIPVIDQSTDYIKGFTNDEMSLIKTDKARIVFGDHTRILKLINFDFARGADGTQVLLSKNRKMPQHLFFHSLLKIDLSNYGYARHFKFLKDSKIILPKEAIANKFEVIVSVYFEKIKSNVFQNQELSSLRDWLLPMLMNGQVSVGAVDKEYKIEEEVLGRVAEPIEKYS